jgi:hypothetical protein
VAIRPEEAEEEAVHSSEVEVRTTEVTVLDEADVGGSAIIAVVRVSSPSKNAVGKPKKTIS